MEDINRNKIEIINKSRGQGKSLIQAIHLLEEIKKMSKNKLFGIMRLSYGGFALTKQKVISYETIIDKIRSIEYAMEDEEDEKARYYYNAQIDILKELLGERE